MNPDAWSRAKELLADALEQPEEARQAFLIDHCDDPELRAQVDALLRYASDAQIGGTRDRLNVVERALEADLELAGKDLLSPPTLIASTIPRYRVISLLGVGGMGEVYRARDLRLDRDVAIKILPKHLDANPQAVKRFEREAKAVAALSHPNILAIHDFAIEAGVCYAVMELLEGESLRTALQRSPLPWRRAVAIGVAVAEGLSAAHAKGIIHRDLKPENIFLTSDGQVKILDFGIARVKRSLERPRTDESVVTRPWAIMGTVGYMSPEQVRGEEAEATSDVFALGCVLYEMIAGQTPFARATATETMAAILRDEAPALAREDVGSVVEQVIRRALGKSTGERFQTARDMCVALKMAVNAPEPDIVVSGMPPESRRHVSLARLTIAPLAPLRARPKIWIGAVTAIALLGITSWLSLGLLTEPALDSVAVLPLVNASGNPDVEYVSEGLTEALIDTLSQMPQLKRVIARSTVSNYKGKEVDPRRIGQELNVRAVLSARMNQRGNDLIVGAELINTADGARLWGEQYSRDPAGVIGLETEITRQVSEKLRIPLTRQQRQRLEKRHTDSSEAHNLYFKGRYFLNKYTEDGWKTGLQYFKQAIELDPTYALAWVGIADSYYQMSSLVLPAGEAIPKAKAAAMKALELDETLVEARTSLAVIEAQYEWDWLEAEKNYKRALELNPNYALAHQYYAWSLAVQGRLDEAIAELRRAGELAPLDPLVSTNLAWVYYLARQYDDAIARYRRIIESDPKFAAAHYGLALAYQQSGKREQAIEELQNAARLDPESAFVSALLSYAYATSGKRDEAQRRLDELKESAKRRHVDPCYIALIYLGLQSNDEVFAWLEKAYEARSEELIVLKVDPRFDPLRSDARYADLLRRLNLSS